MIRLLVGLLRTCLWCLGIILFGGGLLGLAMPGTMHSEVGETHPHVLQLADGGMVGYGLLLLLHWRVLARVLPLAVLLVTATLGLLGAAFFMAKSDQAVALRLARLALVLSPMGLALGFVACDYRNLARLRS